MADDDLLDRILGEVRERKEAARAAYDESRRLEAALDALGPSSGGAASGSDPADDGAADSGAAAISDGDGAGHADDVPVEESSP